MTMTIRIVMNDEVISFQERSRILQTRKVADEVYTLEEPTGLWLTLRSGVSFCLQETIPKDTFHAGDKIKLVIEK